MSDEVPSQELQELLAALEYAQKQVVKAKQQYVGTTAATNWLADVAAYAQRKADARLPFGHCIDCGWRDPCPFHNEN